MHLCTHAHTPTLTQPSQADIRRRNAAFQTRAVQGKRVVKPPKDQGRSVALWVAVGFAFLLVGGSEYLLVAAADCESWIKKEEGRRVPVFFWRRLFHSGKTKLKGALATRRRQTDGSERIWLAEPDDTIYDSPFRHTAEGVKRKHSYAEQVRSSKSCESLVSRHY